MMKKSYVVLGVLGLLVLGVYGWMFLRPAPPLEVSVLATREGATFIFNGRVKLYEVKVTATPSATASGDEGAAGDADDVEPEIVWHMVPSALEGAEPAEVSTVSYGMPQSLGLRPAPGTRGRGKPFKLGTHYEFEADTSAGVAKASFDTPAK